MESSSVLRVMIWSPSHYSRPNYYQIDPATTRVIISPNGTQIIRIKTGREIRNKIQARNRCDLTGVPKEIIIDATSEIGP